MIRLPDLTSTELNRGTVELVAVTIISALCTAVGTSDVSEGVDVSSTVILMVGNKVDMVVRRDAERGVERRQRNLTDVILG